MKLIQANCRVQFTAEDIDFILVTLGKQKNDANCLVSLLADEETRDTILDDDRLYQAFLEQRGCLRVSSRFYFYVLVRHVLRRAGINDRAVADYVAELLCEFTRQDRDVAPWPGASFEYFFEMLAALDQADDRTAFYIRTHIGNQSLFLSGVFPERIRFRAEYKGFPDLTYYEGLGQSSYRVASDHRLAARYALAPIFATLSDRFQTARLALNDVAQRLFCLGDTDYSLDNLLQSGI